MRSGDVDNSPPKRRPITGAMWDILFLLEAGELTDFEREFIKGLKKFKGITPKQEPVIRKIISKYLRTQPPGVSKP